MRGLGLVAWALWGGWLAGCGPTIIEKRVIEAPPPEALRPQPSAEEAAGTVPALLDLRPAVPLVPAGFVAPASADDPRPLVLLEAAVGAAGGEGEAGAASEEAGAGEAGAASEEAGAGDEAGAGEGGDG